MELDNVESQELEHAQIDATILASLKRLAMGGYITLSVKSESVTDGYGAFSHIETYAHVGFEEVTIHSE